MVPPTPPTDNLYKFQALSGILLVFASITIAVVLWEKIHDRLWTVREAIAPIEVDQSELQRQQNELRSRVEEVRRRRAATLRDAKALEAKVDHMESQAAQTVDRKAVQQAKDENNHLRSHYDQIQRLDALNAKTLDDLDSRGLILSEKIALAAAKNEELEDLKRSGCFVAVMTVLLFVIGTRYAHQGFRSWAKVTQKIADHDAQIAQEIAKTNLSKLKLDSQKVEIETEKARIEVEKLRTEVEKLKTSTEPSGPIEGPFS